MQVLGEEGVRRWAMRAHTTLQRFLQEVRVLGVQSWHWSHHCHLSSHPPSQQHCLRCHLHAIPQAHTTITSHQIITEASWLASFVYPSFATVCFQQSSQSPSTSLPIWGFSNGSQLTQKKARVLTMASSLLFPLGSPPSAHPFAQLAPALLTSLLSPRTIFIGFLFRAFHLPFPLPGICVSWKAAAYSPSHLYPNVTSQWGLYPLHTPYPPPLFYFSP